MTTQEKEGLQDYDASQIKVLEWLEPVRQRPWMYIWSTDERWLHHMIQEIVDNAVDEAMAGFCDSITTVLHKDNSITVYDNGRWIPVDKHQKTWKSALETVFTVLHAGWKFDKWVYKVSWWLHWVGASVVNALSEYLHVEVHKRGKIHKQSYERWVPQWELEIIGDTDKTWTIVNFKPDSEIFDTIDFSWATEVARMKQWAYLTPKVTFTFIDEKNNLQQRFYFEWWIKTWLTNLVWNQLQLSSQHYVLEEWKECLAELSFQFVNTSNDHIMSFVNNIPTKDWWHHVLWFKSALLNIMNEIWKEKDKIDKKIWEFQYSDITDGLYAIISVKIPEPQFEWQTKGRLWNAYVRREVEKIMYNYLRWYFATHEEEFDKIFEKINLSARARLAAKFAKETVLRKNILAGGVLPGKLSDCAKKWKEWTELYIVEGDSAGWSAKQWRDSNFQAILPLKGKILNTEQAHIQKIIANTEIKNIITAIWTWIKDSYEPETLRYEKIVIMTDADVDGAHIRTLLLTFFFRYMRLLIDNWNLFIACPPIFKYKEWKREKYIYDEKETPELHWFDSEKVEIQRYKGLGEMNPEQLRDTTMDPATRTMNQVTIDDAEEADKLFRILMWEDVQARKHFILSHAKTVKDLDV